eukprot:scaffold29517_cov148-Skeletonema_dohrnii-CCMP3373.AAC.1
MSSNAAALMIRLHMSSNATPATNCLHNPPHADKRECIIMHIANNCSATGRPNYGVYDHLVSMYSCSRGGIKNMWLKHKKMALDKSTPFKIVRKKGSGRKHKHTVGSIKEMVKGVPLTNRKSIYSLAKAINIPHSTLRRLMKMVTERATELREKIDKELDRRPPVLVASGEYIEKKINAGACCIFLQNNEEPRIVGNVTHRPLLVVQSLDDMNDTKFQCHYHFIHDNELQNGNYVICAFVGDMEQSDVILNLPNDIAESYSKHKDSIIGPNTSHHGSYGMYYADGLKASYEKMDESQSSIRNYTTNNTDDQFQVTKESINSCIHQANKYLVNKLDNDDAIKLAANSSCVKSLVELYNMSSLTRPSGLDTLHFGENDLHWCSSNVCSDAGTNQYHTEIDTSMTLILRPYFKSCCERKCSQCRTTFNFEIPVNGSEELKIPLVDGCIILFSGYLLKHRQQNSIYEKTNETKHSCDAKFINISCYSNGRFANNMIKTSERVSAATMAQK